LRNKQDLTLLRHKSKSDNSEQTRYLHRDHIGSVTAITDETGTVVETLSYDPHGKRRQATWEDAVTQVFSAETTRGFTNHEMLDDVGLIHMGGRVYDPDLGRFISADPHIQEPLNGQALNRYSYVLNNPLSYTDPSGYFFSSIFKAIKSVVSAVAGAVKSILNNKVLRTIAAIAIAAIPGAGAPLSSHLLAGFGAGFVASGGNIKAGILGAVTAGAFNYVGGIDFAQHFGQAASAAKVVAHGVIGGVVNEIGGGNFLSGFLAAGVTQSFASSINRLPTLAGRTAAAAVVGGVSAELGGGKFASGALTGAFSRLYNEEVHANDVAGCGRVVVATCARDSRKGFTFSRNIIDPNGATGVAVQRVTRKLDVTNNGNPVISNFGNLTSPSDTVVYYELFQMNNGVSTVPDSFGISTFPNGVSGTITQSGSVMFFPGAIVGTFAQQNGFAVGNVPAAGALFSSSNFNGWDNSQAIPGMQLQINYNNRPTIYNIQ